MGRRVKRIAVAVAALNRGDELARLRGALAEYDAGAERDAKAAHSQQRNETAIAALAGALSATHQAQGWRDGDHAATATRSNRPPGVTP